MTLTLQGKVAVITGAAQGIGLTIAATLVEAGAAAVLCDLADAQGEQAAQTIRSAGGQALYQHTDVSQPADVATLAEKAVDQFGRLDIWINNAKTDVWARVTDLSVEDWDKVLNVCLRAAFLSAKYAIPHMIAAGGGSLINISSVHALLAYPFTPAYDAAKAGLVALARQIAADYGPQGIRANAILPGLIAKSPSGEDSSPWVSAHTKLYPVGRVGTPQDVAEAVRFLVSEGAQFINGTTLVVDGGMSARSPEWQDHIESRPRKVRPSSRRKK